MDHAHALLERMRLDVGQVFDALRQQPLRVLDLFSGIGGFSLGFERAGMRTIGFCEIDPYARAVLAKHWPGVPCHDDVRTLDAGSGIDVVCGGFPCQDISVAGRNAGIDGARSGLWRQMLRIVEAAKPRFVVIENVPALRARGLDTILGALAAIGYDAEWHCIPAATVGAPHRRDRVWLVAHALRDRPQGQEPAGPAPGIGRRPADPGGAAVAHADEPGLEGWRQPFLSQREGERVAGPGGAYGVGSAWLVEPELGRVAHGVPRRVDRLRSLGNAIVPQIAEMIGRAIVQKHAYLWRQHEE